VLKKITHITIREYSLFEQTNDPRLFLRFKFIPLFLVKKGLFTRLITEIFEHLTEKDETKRKLTHEYHRIKSQYRIQMLVALYQATYNLMNGVIVNQWKKDIGRKESKLDNLSVYVEQIKEQTGIEVKSIDDLSRLRKEIERWVDKFNENFKQEKKADGITFMSIVLGVFATMNMPLNYDMYLSDFFELKRQAEQIAELKNKQNAR
jgi:hypothetical protein